MIKFEVYKLHIIFLSVFSVSRENMIGIKNRDHNQSGQSCGESAVVKNKSAVHACGRRAYDCVNQAGEQTFFPTVSACNRAKSCGESNTVDVCLRGKHPRKRFSEEGVYNTHDSGQCDIAEHNGCDVSWVLTVGGKGQCSENGADRGTCETCSDRKTDLGEKQSKKLRRKEDRIQISKNTKSVNPEIDETNGHSEFGGKIKSVSCAFDQSAIAVKGFSVHKKSEEDCGEEKNEEKDIHEHKIGIVEGFIYGIVTDNNIRRGKTEGSVQKRVRTNSENSDSQSCLIHIVASLYRSNTGEQSRDDESR